MRIINYGCAALLSLIAWPAQGQQSFDRLLNDVVSRNISLQASQAANKGEILALKAENNLPDPEVEVEYQWGRHEVGNKFDVNVSQSVDWPGVYTARGKAANTASRAMEYLDRSNRLDKMLETKLLFIDIVNSRKNLDILRDRAAVMDTIYERYQSGVKRGEISVLDLNKIKIERIKLQGLLKSAMADHEALATSLQSMMGGDDPAKIMEALTDYPDELIKPVDHYEHQLTENDPMIEYQSLMSQSQSLVASAERRSRLPGFTFGYHHSWEDGDVFNGAVIGVTLPVFSTRHKVKAAEALQRSLMLEEEAVNVDRTMSMKADRAKAVSLNDQLMAYRGIFETDDNTRLLRKALDGGQMSLIEYLQEMDYYLQARQDYLELAYQYQIVMARLNKYDLLDN